MWVFLIFVTCISAFAPRILATRLPPLIRDQRLSALWKWPNAAAFNFTAVNAALDSGIAKKAYPGYSFALVTPAGLLYSKTGGYYTYGAIPPLNSINEPIVASTKYDMASCTKVVATTSAVARLYQLGHLNLHSRIEQFLGSKFNQNGKQPITVLNCLLHNAGFAPDPRPFWNTVAFGCPQTSNLHPAEDFSCMDQIFGSLLAQKLDNPIGAKYVYSDLSFITLMFVVGSVVRSNNLVTASQLAPGCNVQNNPNAMQCYFEAFVRLHVMPNFKSNAAFLPTSSALRQRCAPTTNDTVYRHEVMQGQVQDQNTYAMGGISGHAGLFASLEDVIPIVSSLVAPTPTSFLNSTTMRLFSTEYNHTQSSRALGWNTNDPTVTDMGWGCSCGTLSPKTFMHLGYTGTMICVDKDRHVGLIMLTNRVYPSASNIKIRAARKAVGRAVQQAIDQIMGPHPTAVCP